MSSLVGRLREARDGLLQLGGLGALAASAWTAWGVAPGLAASGAALLVVQYLTTDEKAVR
ncbi:hypothetical protein GCM10010400_70110 [Streptomyces aculeolatus]|uniref:hypothetical protein n=1 Tax=Streptomyces aculeolatus TaxID=270689 RepID=UPI001CEDD013|nr:hypothetical protein [Streptomyces aculeolatus]